MVQLADSPKKALEDFLNELIQVYYPWYERSVNLHYYVSIPIQTIALLAGFATAVLAAVATQDTFKQFGLVRLLLILLPALGSAATTVAVQSKLYERYQLRENGRRSIQAIYNEGRAKYAAAATPQEYTTIHTELIKKVDDVEAGQSTGIFSLIAQKKAR
jgi:hypothetical protein